MPASFLGLAPDTLHTLIYVGKGAAREIDMSSLARLTHLIHLELICVQLTLDMDVLYQQGVSIEELVLIECENAEMYLLTARKALSCLKLLHIEETEEESRKPLHTGTLIEDAAMQCVRGIDAALNQPDLEQVSGNSKYLAYCMKDPINRAKFRKFLCDGKLISENSRYTDGRYLSLWVRL